MPESISANSITLPAPVGGWNARDPLDTMPEADAIELVNLIPQTGGITTRRGSVQLASGMGTGPVDTLAEWVGGSGTAKLVAGANLNLYEVSTGTASSLASGFSNNQWQSILFRDSGGTTRLILVNGADTPQGYDGTTAAAITYTGTGLTPSNFINVSAYRSRLYFVEKNTTKVWYTNTPGASSGACTEFDVGSLFNQGGYLMAAVPTTRDTYAGTVEQMAFISSQGDVLVYEGANPGDASWSLTARFQMPAPIGRRCTCYLGAQLMFLTVQGVIPFSAILTSQTEETYNKLSDKIQSAFVDAAEDYSANFGWQLLSYPQRHMLIVNVPVATGTQSEQAVLNTLTGAWCKFVGVNACSWALYQNRPYFGGPGGIVYRFDQGFSDDGTPIEFRAKTAFNYCGDRQRLKRFTMARPILASSQTFNLGFNIDVDFEDRAITTGADITGTALSYWDTSAWDSAAWSGVELVNRSMYSVDGVGRCAAFRVFGTYVDLDFELTAFHLNFEAGGLI